MLTGFNATSTQLVPDLPNPLAYVKAAQALIHAKNFQELLGLAWSFPEIILCLSTAEIRHFDEILARRWIERYLSVTSIHVGYSQGHEAYSNKTIATIFEMF